MRPDPGALGELVDAEPDAGAGGGQLRADDRVVGRLGDEVVDDQRRRRGRRAGRSGGPGRLVPGRRRRARTAGRRSPGRRSSSPLGQRVRGGRRRRSGPGAARRCRARSPGTSRVTSARRARRASRRWRGSRDRSARRWRRHRQGSGRRAGGLVRGPLAPRGVGVVPRPDRRRRVVAGDRPRRARVDVVAAALATRETTCRGRRAGSASVLVPARSALARGLVGLVGRRRPRRPRGSAGSCSRPARRGCSTGPATGPGDRRPGRSTAACGVRSTGSGSRLGLDRLGHRTGDDRRPRGPCDRARPARRRAVGRAR